MTLEPAERIVCTVALLAIAVCSVVVTVVRPIADPTEGRYASTARAMAERGDWVTPRVVVDGRDVPYLGKPPLAFWCAAAAVRVFGAEPWAVRLPAVVFAWWTVALVAGLARRRWGGRAGLCAALALASMPLAIGVGHAVTVDVVLAFTIALTVASFARADASRLAAYGVFVGMGLSMLAKGPIGVVLAGLPIVFTSFGRHRVASLSALPWVGGTALSLAICAPWYWLAERANPGFLHYFFYREHVLRYLTTEYGDRYGRGHDYPYGSILVMFVAVSLPWSLAALGGLRRAITAPEPATRLAVGWSAAPLGVFTFARNITAAYALPACAGLALLVARWRPGRGWCAWPIVAAAGFGVAAWPGVVANAGHATADGATTIFGLAAALSAGLAITVARASSSTVRLAALALVAPLGFVAAVFALQPGLARESSTAAVLARCDALDPRVPVTFIYRTPGSALFYRGARIEPVPGERLGARPPVDTRLLVARRRHWERMDATWRGELRVLDRVGPWLIARVAFPPGR